MLGAVVAATAAVTFGSAGIASADCSSSSVISNWNSYTCLQIQNFTGYEMFDEYNNQAPIAPGEVVYYTSYPSEVMNLFFAINPNPNTPDGGGWYLTFINSTPGAWALSNGFSSGSTFGSASFDSNTDSLGQTLTLGGSTTAFTNAPPNDEDWSVLPVTGVPSTTTGVPSTTSHPRGTIVRFSRQKSVKVWGPRTNPLRGVAAKPTAPVSVGEEVSPVSSTLPAQTRSVAKTATPHRVASPRAAVTASGSAPSA